MKKVPNHPRLYRRGATYYHRAQIPRDIRDTYPKTSETFSLDTKDYREAVRKLRVAAAEVDRRFEVHRRRQAQQARPPLQELSDAQIKRIAEIYYAYRLGEDDETRLAGFYDPAEPLPWLPAPTFEEYRADTETLEASDRENYARGKIDDFYLGEAEEALTWDGIDLCLAPRSPSWRPLARALQTASIRAQEAIGNRNSGIIVDTPNDTTESTDTATPSLSSAIEDWIDEKSRTTWVPKTMREHRVWAGHFLAITGDRPLDRYSKSDGRRFKEILVALPANWIKYPELKRLPIDKASEKARALSLPRMSDNNVNKILGFVGSFWSWAANSYDGISRNPMQGLKVKTRRHARAERDPFSVQELDSIFSIPLYTGCHSLRRWKTPGPCIPRDSGYYWVPLIALYSGARLGEIVQLYASDVGELDNIRYLDINGDGPDKRLKNHNSRRTIPIHPELIAFGFLDYVRARAASGSHRLFPDLPMGQDGYYSSPFSKHFTRVLIAAGVKRDKNTFHSFRHSFEDACRDSGVSKELMDALQGHGEHGMSARYGKGYLLAKLDEAMRTIRYRGLNLEHLKTENT